MNLRYVICSEIIDVRDGTHDSPKYIIDGGYPLITSKNINNNKIDFSNVNYISEEDYIKINQRSEVSNGDIIMPMIGTIGNPVIIDTDKKFAIKNVALFKLANNETILSKYFYYILKTQDIKRQLESNKRGGTQNFVSLKNIRDLKIPLIDILEQKKIVEILDKAQQLIDKRKKQIESLDELVKSQFIEMFGDPITNPKRWNTCELREGIKEIKYGTSTPPVFSEEGVPFVRATNIKFGRIIENDMKYISEQESKKIEKCKLELGDTIIVRSGANTGDNAFVSEEYVGAYGGYDIIVKLNKKINYIFLNAILNSVYREIIIEPLTRRAGQPHLNSGQIQSLVVFMPPIELQNKFADFVKRVDKLKFEMEK
ncbi:restriction endonuclease subunit S, partial [uncultured Clostridium sp.]|uniref:restriction endonuclease subunit S n=1 Tax=uncultured Clostridium sp. TaxID=59620 RepID=UPI00273137BA